MRVESGRRAVLRLEVEGRPAQTYSMPGSTTSRTARKIAGAAIQGWKRTPRMPGATGRPQAEQYRLSGLSRYRQAGQWDSADSLYWFKRQRAAVMSRYCQILLNNSVIYRQSNRSGGPA